MRAASTNFILKCQKVFNSPAFCCCCCWFCFVFFGSRTRKLCTWFDTLIFTKHSDRHQHQQKNVTFQLENFIGLTFERLALFFVCAVPLLIYQWLIFALIANICFEFGFILFCGCSTWNRIPSVFKAVELFDVYFISTSTNSTTKMVLCCRAIAVSYVHRKCVRFFFGISILVNVFSRKDSFLRLLHPSIWIRNVRYYAPCTRIHYRQNVLWMKRTKEWREREKNANVPKPNISIFSQSLW